MRNGEPKKKQVELVIYLLVSVISHKTKASEEDQGAMRTIIGEDRS